MILWDILNVSKFDQKFEIYVTNMYDQNLPIGNGTRAELMAQEQLETYGKDEFLVFDHLQDTIDSYFIRDGIAIVFVFNEQYKERLEEQYDASYVQKWSWGDRNSRPFLTTWEIEHGKT